MAFKQRNFRPRSKLSFGDEEEAQEEEGAGARARQVQQKPQNGAGKPASKPPAQPAADTMPKRDSKASLLSFGEDGGEDEDCVLLAAHKKKDRPKSRIGRAQGLPELPATAHHTTQLSGAGEYTAERLKELQRNALAFTASKAADGSGGGGGRVSPSLPGGVSHSASEPVIKLSGTFKPSAGAQPKDDRFTINQAAPVRPASAAAAAPAPHADKKERSTTPTPAAAPAGQSKGQPTEAQQQAAEGLPDEDEEDDTIIPDEETIRRAKAKRERLRHAHLAPDYVPLGGTSKLLQSTKVGGGGASESLQGGEVAPGGSDSEGELEEHMRIKFTVAGTGADGSKRRGGGGYTRTLEGPTQGPTSFAGEDDEEVPDFAEEQLRKAVRRNQAAMPTAQQGGQHYSHQGGDGQAVASHQHAMGGAMAKSRMEGIQSAGQAAIAALREGVARLQASHNAVKANLSKTGTHLATSLSRIDQLEKDGKQASEKYIFVQEVRTYVGDLIDCLHDKSVLVEELEASLMELREDRAAAGAGATQALEEEMVRPAQAAISAALGVLGRGGLLPVARLAAEAAAAAEEERMDEEAVGPDEVDEFGRSLTYERRREAQERRKQRVAAVQRESSYLEALAAGSPLNIQDDPWQLETDAQVARYNQRHGEVMTAADTVFADAGEEFASLPAVKRRLEEFKHRYPKDYANTYMSLSIPALFAPYVRLELLRWDPLYADAGSAGQQQGNGTSSEVQAQREAGMLVRDGQPAAAGQGGAAREGVYRSFDKQAWYESLFDYGMGQEGGEQHHEDPDANLVPDLVRKLVLPLAEHTMERCWDPLVGKHSSIAATIVGDLLVYVPVEEPGMVALLDHVMQGLKRALSKVTLPPWPPVALEASPLAQAVLSRRFRMAVRLLHTLAPWEGVLSRAQLMSMALDQVLTQQLLPYLRAGVSAGAAQPLVAVGRLEAVAAALPAGWFEGGCPPQAAPLMELLVSMADTLEGAPRASRPGKLTDAARLLAKQLQRLGNRQRAARLAAAYGVQL